MKGEKRGDFSGAPEGPSWLAETVKNLPAMHETWVRSLGGEDPLEKGMATHSSILAWRIPQTEEPGRATGHKESDMNVRLTLPGGPVVKAACFHCKGLGFDSRSGK